MKIELSLPPREAWIEIGLLYAFQLCFQVASPAGSVD